jgi:hypothetical protein
MDQEVPDQGTSVQMNHQEVQVKRNICANGSSGSGNGTSGKMDHQKQVWAEHLAMDQERPSWCKWIIRKCSNQVVQVEHLVQMDHQGSAGPAEHQEVEAMDHRSVAETSGANGSSESAGSGRDICANGSSGSAGSAVRSSEVQVKRC